ncbi:nucleotide sugar dehydrogenase [Paenibacillaceae bacterium WGS1546]|uniref:nucleotide sugar dehydrogenase n=1 Tax=Cohnella sp. WGS1546 TaxID=3366810 RepID=UPI00372D53B8
MSLYLDLLNRRKKIAVIGLGYVGLPLAIELAKKYDVVGYDNNPQKIEKYINGIDVTKEVGDEILKNTSIRFTSNEHILQECSFLIVAVPTPLNSDKTPDLKPVVSASRTIGRNLKKESFVVFESTVYPGTTEEICVPEIEKESGLTLGLDFKVGYSPERINPGDRVHTLTNIVKVVSASDAEALKVISDVYNSIIAAGIYPAQSIKVAEASKVIENAQRDINIAFMNELSIVFHKMGIDTKEVLKASSTKWNFLDFKPGLVGGHCIGVDPYYFIYKAEQLGYNSQIISAGRRINNDMGVFVANNVVKKLVQSDQLVKGSRVGILGITFKENCSDVRNTKVIDIINELDQLEIELLVYDPLANEEEVLEEYGIQLVSEKDLTELNGLVIAVPHNVFKDNYDADRLSKFYKDEKKVLIDIKGMLEKKDCEKAGFYYWSL